MCTPKMRAGKQMNHTPPAYDNLHVTIWYCNCVSEKPSLLGKSYTFRSEKEVTPAEMEAVRDLLNDECVEVEFREVFK
jgi:hypothetical protein